MDPTAGEDIAVELSLSIRGGGRGSPADEAPPPLPLAIGAEEYVRVLEEEEKTIVALQQELPLCKRLLSHAIEDLKKKKKKKNKKKKKKKKSKEKVLSCSGKSSSLRIFGKLVIAGADDDEDEGEIKEEPRERTMECRANYQGSKWIKSSSEKKKPQFAGEEKEIFPGSGNNAIGSFGGFFPLAGAAAAISEKRRPCFILPSLTNSAAPAVGGGGWSLGGSASKQPAPLAAGHRLINPQPPKKSRLCWTPELHRRFRSAIEQLGGDEAATPKRIRDLMKVEGITSDQVRSHLQKYRLSAQRAMDSSHATTSNVGSECVEQQRVIRRFGYPQMAPYEMPFPPTTVTVAGKRRK